MSRPVNKDVWKDRPKSFLVKELMEDFNIPLAEAAEILGTGISYINNKLSRNNYSFEDLLLLLHAAGLRINLVDKNDEIWRTISLKERTCKLQVL